MSYEKEVCQFQQAIFCDNRNWLSGQSYLWQYLVINVFDYLRFLFIGAINLFSLLSGFLVNSLFLLQNLPVFPGDMLFWFLFFLQELTVCFAQIRMPSVEFVGLLR